jgi:hypothetical protein
MRVGQEALKMLIPQPTHASSTQTDNRSVQHFELLKMSLQLATSKQRSPKIGFSLNGSRAHERFVG